VNNQTLGGGAYQLHLFVLGNYGNKQRYSDTEHRLDVIIASVSIPAPYTLT
jgi:hypothetical protein